MPKRRKMDSSDARGLSVTTRSMATTRTSIVNDKVLNTTEILEHILSFLPLRDIIEKQLVCKQWRALIEKSPTLRRLRFLDADTSAKASGMRTTHPFLLSIPRESAKTWKSGVEYTDFRRSLTWKNGRAERWEEIFITQPPVQKLTFTCVRFYGAYRSASSPQVIEDADGIRFGHLAREIRMRLGANEVHVDAVVKLEEI